MKDESISKMMGQVLEMNLLFKKMLNETTDRYLEHMNIAPRNDLSNIFSLIVNVDSKLDDLEEIMEDTKSNQVNQVELKREMTDIKNKMKNLDTKLKEILIYLKTEKKEKTEKIENNKETAGKSK